MLAYDAGFPVRYDALLTIASVVAAVAITTVAWWVSLTDYRFSTALSGVLVSAGIATMHYTGMAAVEFRGDLNWDYRLVAASLIASAMLSVCAVREQRRNSAVIPWRPAAILVLAICALHFIAMGAVSFSIDPRQAITDAVFDRNALVALILAGTVLIIALGFFVVLIDRLGERERAAAKIAHLAYHDALTGLSNRSVFDQHLAQSVEQARRSGQSLAVICIDLDRFKVVNDVHGHLAGDLLLVETADRLRSVTRGHELVARVGGDEFIIVQQGGDRADATAVASRVIEALARRFVIGGTTVLTGASVGIAIFPDDASTADELSQKADTALYSAKEAGKGVARFYDAAIERHIEARRAIEMALPRAIREDRLAVHYQPIANVGTGSISGYEALLRWTDPDLGVIDPEVFIAVAEEKGLIRELGMWVLHRACRDARAWRSPLAVCVNFSPVQFLQEDLAKSVALVLAETGVDPRRLEVEVTESVLISEPEKALCIFNELKALGVRISLDDFGTGYSSLSYFRVFPFDKVKIDRSFVSDLAGGTAREIVRSVIELSKNLGITVVAEGVETQFQLDLLRELRCEQVQGYLIGRPRPIEHLSDLVGGSPGAKARAA